MQPILKKEYITHDELDRMYNYPDLQSAGASIQNLLLVATAKGYGTCWMTGPLLAREKIQQLLDIKGPWHRLSFVAIGKTGGDGKKLRTKRDLCKEIVFIF